MKPPSVLPISPKNDSWLLWEAITRMFVRTSQLARKRPSPLSLQIPPDSVALIAIFDDYYNSKITLQEAIKKIDEEVMN